MPEPENYTVGWICAIKTEYVAARAFLDELHKDPIAVSPNDNNAYTTGKMGEHNVVIAVLPDGEYGISSAASVARDMMHSFSNIRIGLMVGIGGGAPSKKHDIRLGDIVVSAPRDGKGGVFQYDFGKTIQDQSFRPTGFLNQPPAVLRTAMTVISGQYESDGHNIETDINDILQKKPRLRKTYSRPDPSSDKLYQPGVVHPVNGNGSCADVCGDDLSKLILRDERTECDDNPTIHYGLIASASQLIKDALIRDKLAAEMGVLCFEMEAAGLMNHFPCLVVRGICDYSDSHKNREWQGYAAMAAAAYAKDLLCQILPSKIEAEKKIGDILSGLHEVTKEHLDIGKEQLQFHKDLAEEDRKSRRDLAKERLSKKEQECLQLFRLTSGTNDATYEWYKDRVEDRLEGTCQWLLNHEYFHSWLKQESGPLLVSADPGCGKSVLAKYLIDDYLPRAATSATICYFFFKDQDQNTVRQALCALLHQLFSHKPWLIKHAIPQFLKDGKVLNKSTVSLWEVLENAVQDPKAGPIILVLDGLDECAEREFADLMRGIRRQFHSDQSGFGKIKYLLTSRPYEQIVSKFSGLLEAFPNIRIPGEEESEIISQEVNRVITHRIGQLSTKKGLNAEIVAHLEKRLQETTQRTYLWVYLVFDYLESEQFKKTLKGVDSTIATLPKTVGEAYEQILNKSKDHSMVWKALRIILAANRPLTLLEMNIALNIEHTSQSIHDLDLENVEDFKSRFRSCCGLFVSIHHGQIYFLHQTAREFLLADSAGPTDISSDLRWHHSVTTCQAHAVLAKLCVLYLNLFNSDDSIPTGTNGEGHQSIDSHAFLDYSAQTWGGHFREASILADDAIVPYALRISNPNSRSYSAWSRIFWQNTSITATDFTDLIIASYFGHTGVVKLLVEKGANVEATDSRHGQTPLSWAGENGHVAVVEQLLEKGANIEATDKYGQTPLSWAGENGREAVVKLLLEKGANIEATDKYGRTPLSLAATRGQEAVVKQLLEKGANIEATDTYGRTPLLWAAENRQEAVVKQLLANLSIDPNITDGTDQSLLSWTMYYRRPALFWAAEKGQVAVVQQLLEKGANIEAIDNVFGRTPLSWAAEEGHAAVVKLLLEKGANIKARDKDGQTPLSWAAKNGHVAVVKQLLEKGANIEATDKYGQTPLSLAATSGHVGVVKQLHEKGANVEARGTAFGRTPLALAAKNGHVAVVTLLLEKGANIEATDKYDRTPLSLAATHGQEAVVKQLLANLSIDPNITDGTDQSLLSWTMYYRRPALFWAAEKGQVAVVQQLLEKGANIEAIDNVFGRTPLSWAAEKGHAAVVKLLLEKGANIKATDKNGRTPLSWAAENGHEAVVKLLRIKSR